MAKKQTKSERIAQLERELQFHKGITKAKLELIGKLANRLERNLLSIDRDILTHPAELLKERWIVVFAAEPNEAEGELHARL